MSYKHLHVLRGPPAELVPFILLHATLHTRTLVRTQAHVCYMHYDTDTRVCKVFHYGIFLCTILASWTRILVNLFWHDEGSVFFQRFACCWYLPITVQHAETDNAEYQILQQN